MISESYVGFSLDKINTMITFIFFNFIIIFYYYNYIFFYNILLTRSKKYKNGVPIDLKYSILCP